MAATRTAALIIRPPASTWPSLGAHLRRLFEYHDLLRTLTVHRINVRYRQTLLGLAWAVLQPLLMMLVFVAVFSRLARVPSEGVPYALFAYCALLPWTCFASGISSATGSLVSHAQLITKVYFPREILPLTYVIAAMFDFALGLVTLVGLMLWYQVPITMMAGHLVPIVLLLCAWMLAVSLLLSAAQVRWRDIGVAIPLIVQLGMFASPVIYPLAVVPESWRAWYLLNPMAGIINAFRDTLLRGAQPDAVPVAYAAAVTGCLLPIAYAIFKRAEATMADVV